MLYLTLSHNSNDTRPRQHFLHSSKVQCSRHYQTCSPKVECYFSGVGWDAVLKRDDSDCKA